MCYCKCTTLLKLGYEVSALLCCECDYLTFWKDNFNPYIRVAGVSNPVGVKNASYLPYAGACYDDKFSTGINSFSSNNKL